MSRLANEQSGFDPELAPNVVPLGFDKSRRADYDLDDAYAAVADALGKADEVAELAMDVGEGRAALEWAYENAPREYRNALSLLHLQAKKLAKDAGEWGRRNAR